MKKITRRWISRLKETLNEIEQRREQGRSWNIQSLQFCLLQMIRSLPGLRKLQEGRYLESSFFWKARSSCFCPETMPIGIFYIQRACSVYFWQEFLIRVIRCIIRNFRLMRIFCHIAWRRCMRYCLALTGICSRIH